MLKILDSLRHEVKFAATYVLRENFICDRMIARLRSHEEWSIDDLKVVSCQLLLRTLKAAVRAIPAYRGIRLDCDEHDVEEVLKTKFPIVDKEQILSKRELFYPFDGRPRPWTVVGETGGTTGTPLQLFRSLPSILWQNAYLKRQWTWAGFRDGMPRAVLRGDAVIPAEQTRPPFWIWNRYMNQLFLSLVHLRAETVNDFIEKVQQFGPYMMETYPSAAYELAKYLEKRNLCLEIPYIFTGSEPLFDYQRQIIEERFRTRVLDHYGMGERVTFATECEHGNLHVNSDHSYTEIVDEHGNATDDYGYVVGTTFHNLVMPLVRYKLSDQTKWKRGECSCGRRYPMIERVTGRVEEIIVGSRGNDIGPLLFRILHGVDCIDRVQIAQVERYRLEIRIVPDSKFSNRDREKIVNNLHRYVDANLKADVVLVNEISRTRRGKYRWIVNEYIDGDRER